jgi:MGT family glycosyltransferase
MKGNHIAFISSPFFGYINPALCIVATLVRRGYRVTYAVSDRFASIVSDVGAEFISYRPLPNIRGVDEWAAWSAGILEDLTPFYEANKPDLIIYDSWCPLPGLIFAKNWTVPAIQTSPDFLWDKNQMIAELESGSEFSDWYRAYLEASKIADLERYGFGELGFLKEKLNIFFYSKVFQWGQTALDESCFYAGRCAPEQPLVRKWQAQHTDGRPILLVATSTVYSSSPDYFRVCIDALAGLHWHVVLSIGDNNPASFNPLPPHFELVHHISHLDILPYAELLIHTGAIITAVESIYHGVPLLMITHGHQQLEMQAENNVRLGLGRHLRQTETTAENIRQSVLEISKDVALLRKVKEMQHLIQRDPGGEDTANRILEYLESTIAKSAASSGS